MSKSTQVITDLKSCGTPFNGTAFTATQKTRAIAAAGPITDLDGAVSIAVLKAQELRRLMTYIVVDSTGVEGGNNGVGALVQTAETNFSALSGVYEVMV